MQTEFRKKIRINLSLVFLFFLSLGISTFFLKFFYDPSFYRGIATSAGEIAYNVYRYNSTRLNQKRGSYIHSRQEHENSIIQYAEVDHSQFGEGTSHKYIAETVGYGVLLGLLWKITNSLNYRDIQILQIILYALSIFLIYGLASMLFNNDSMALACSVAHLFFFPGAYLNMYTLRDAWVYYGLIVLFYIFIRYLILKKSIFSVFCGSIFFALCQFIRPNIKNMLNVFFTCFFFKRENITIMLNTITGIK